MADLSDKKVFFVLGGPGAGKGTQCAKLVEEKGLSWYSAGDLLRAERDSGSENGDLIKSYIEEGKIVPMEITIGLLRTAIENDPNDKGFLIDGFPRAMDQCEGFESSVVPGKCCLFFNCPEETLLERLMKRAETSGRSDDNIESIRKRFRTYQETTMPVIDFFRDDGRLQEIDCTGTIDEVFELACAAVDSANSA